MSRFPRTLPTLALLAAALAAPACDGGGGDRDGAKSGATSGDPMARPSAEALEERYGDVLDIPDVEYRWDPAAGDKSVPAELGGPGFTGEGWKTNMKYPAIGSAEAVRGGTMTQHIPDWPATLRLWGENHNSSFNTLVRSLCTETLLGLHPTTLEFTPSLATHWQISDDRMVYRFRLNPEARWSDGREVTADDVVATFRLNMDPTGRDPSSVMTFSKLDTPVALSKYMVEVRAKEENWRNFLYFASSMPIFPKAAASIPGSEFLDRYQNSYPPLSGPYEVRLEDIEMGQSLSIRRRSDWWQEGNPGFTGMYNIDRLRFVIVKSPELAYEKAKKGEIELYLVGKAQWWAEEIPNLEPVKRGLLKMAKIYNDEPVGTNGLAFNMDRPPLDDVRVRKALAHLYNRELFIEKLFFNEYVPLNSYYAGGIYENPDNVPVQYDVEEAVRLLEEAGWKEDPTTLVRAREGRPLKLNLMYRSPLSERSLTLFQEACRQAGVVIDLQLLTSASMWKNLQEKEYDIASTEWYSIVFPNPETSWKSTLAGVPSNNNVVNFRDKRVDELCEAYDREYDVERRREIIREIDGIIHRAHPYALGWYNPAQRFLYWDKFGMPPWGNLRTGYFEDMASIWWVDPEKERQLEAAKRDSSITLPRGEVENHFWEAWSASQEDAAADESGE